MSLLFESTNALQRKTPTGTALGWWVLRLALPQFIYVHLRACSLPIQYFNNNNNLPTTDHQPRFLPPR